MSRRIFILGAHPEARRRAHAAIDEAPDGYACTIGERGKKRAQEEKYHAQIDDCAKCATYAGKKWDRDDMKRILIDEFADEMRKAGTPLHHDGRLIPSEDGCRVIQLGIQSSNFRVREASDFIEFLYAWGGERGVVWTEAAVREAVTA
jgi:hypothetical protein